MAQVSEESHKETSHLTLSSRTKGRAYQASSKARRNTNSKMEGGVGVFAWACLRSPWDAIEPSRKRGGCVTLSHWSTGCFCFLQNQFFIHKNEVFYSTHLPFPVARKMQRKQRWGCLPCLWSPPLHPHSHNSSFITLLPHSLSSL